MTTRDSQSLGKKLSLIDEPLKLGHIYKSLIWKEQFEKLFKLPIQVKMKTLNKIFDPALVLLKPIVKTVQNFVQAKQKLS